MWQMLLGLLGTCAGVFVLFKYILLVEMRLDSNIFKTLYDVSKNNKRRFIIQEEFVCEDDDDYPNSYISFYFLKDCPWFFISHSERLLTAGYQGKDYVTHVTFFRWNQKRMKDFLKTKLKEMQSIYGVPVGIILPNYIDKIGTLKNTFPEPVANKTVWKDIDDDFQKMMDGKLLKTSALLYGTPGNGKSSLVKYLATKYKLPIRIITFSPDWSNYDFMIIFSQITKKCIVLFEDFDNYFDKRTCILGSGNEGIKFTFDIILNGLDGVYNTYEQVAFIMTVNDLNKVDMALRNRPSRFKYVREFCNPSLEERRKIIPEEWARKAGDINLDQVFRLKEYHEIGDDFSTAMKKLSLEPAEVQPEKRHDFQNISLARLSLPN